MSDQLKSMLNNLINDKHAEATLDLHEYITSQVKATIAEAKSGGTYPWAKEMLKAAGLPDRGEASYSDDGEWFSAEKIKKAIAGLEAAGFKKSGKEGQEIQFKSKEAPSKGITFSWDDPEEKGKVGAHFWDTSMH